MATCRRCNREIGILGSMSFNKQTQRCGSCENVVKGALQRFRGAFLNYCSDGILTPQEWMSLQNGAAQDQLNLDEALAFIMGDALNFLQRSLTFASADGMITQEEEHNILNLRRALAIPDMIARPLLQQLEYLKYITKIRQGELPKVQTRTQLESDELCHLETAATYHKINSRSRSLILSYAH